MHLIKKLGDIGTLMEKKSLEGMRWKSMPTYLVIGPRSFISYFDCRRRLIAMI